MNTVNSALQHIQARREHILGQFVDNTLSKAISSDEFKQKYSTEHEVYTPKSLAKFIDDSVEKNGGESAELIKSMQDEFATLSEVIVKEGPDEQPKYLKYFVRAMKAE